MREKSMVKEHQYHFEFKYNKMVNGEKKEYVVPITAINKSYIDACTRVDEYVRKNFGERVDEESTIKYVGEFVGGELKKVVEDVKKESENPWFDATSLKRAISEGKQYNFIVGGRGSGKTEFNKMMNERFEKERAEFGKFYCDTDINMMKEIYEALERKQIQTMDMRTMYPEPYSFKEKTSYEKAVDVCKVYQLERDQALKENEVLKERVKNLTERNNRLEVNEKYYDGEYRKLSDEKQNHEMVINGYKKELSQLNLLMDDMEDRLDKHVLAREGMLKQLREYKADAKRKNKIIDALTEDKDEK